MASLEDKLAPLRARFRQRLLLNRADISALAAEQTIEAAREVGRTAHKIAGLGGSLGYGDLSIYAKSVDRLSAASPESVFASGEYRRFIDELDRIVTDEAQA